MHNKEIKALEIRNKQLISEAIIYIERLNALDVYNVIITYKELKHTYLLIIEELERNAIIINNLKGDIQ